MSILKVVKDSFIKYLQTGSRSNEKLKILHGKIAADLRRHLGNEYQILSLGVDEGKEGISPGRYMDKKVDISVYKSGKPIAGIAVKFVMSNYCQNSNNYFENMLGETANIRSNNVLYFQILIIPEEMPYYDQNEKIKRVEKLTPHYLEKYMKLSKDDISSFKHTPDKTLLMIIKLPDLDLNEIKTKEEYVDFYKTVDVGLSSVGEGEYEYTVVYNQYEEFIEKVSYAIKSR